MGLTMILPTTIVTTQLTPNGSYHQRRTLCNIDPRLNQVFYQLIGAHMSRDGDVTFDPETFYLRMHAADWLRLASGQDTEPPPVALLN